MMHPPLRFAIDFDGIKPHIQPDLGSPVAQVVTPNVLYPLTQNLKSDPARSTLGHSARLGRTYPGKMSTQLPFFTLFRQEVEDQLGTFVRAFEEGKMANAGQVHPGDERFQKQVRNFSQVNVEHFLVLLPLALQAWSSGHKESGQPWDAADNPEWKWRSQALRRQAMTAQSRPHGCEGPPCGR